MNGAGLFLAVAGAWVLSQILAGDALDRLGLFGDSTGSTIGDAVNGVAKDAAKGLLDIRPNQLSPKARAAAAKAFGKKQASP